MRLEAFESEGMRWRKPGGCTKVFDVDCTLLSQSGFLQQQLFAIGHERAVASFSHS